MLASNISLHSAGAELFGKAVLIVCEEFPMANKASIKCVNQLLRIIMNNHPFGGKLFLALGDFHQVAPVIRNCSGPIAAYQSSIRSSFLWNNFQILNLDEPIRNASDPQYPAWIDQSAMVLLETTILCNLIPLCQSIIFKMPYCFSIHGICSMMPKPFRSNPF